MTIPSNLLQKPEGLGTEFQISGPRISETVASGNFLLFENKKNNNNNRRVDGRSVEPAATKVISYEIGVPRGARTSIAVSGPQSPGATFAPSEAS